MAYGTVTARMEDGEFLIMPKMIRNTQKATLVRMCKAHLRSFRFPVPCDVTLYKILDVLPAAPARIMVGINPHQEEAMTSFGVLVEITKRLTVYGLKPEACRMIIASIQTIHTYIRSHFHLGIEMHSEYASHCATFANSDSSLIFGKECQVRHTKVDLTLFLSFQLFWLQNMANQ